jgi:glycosyltransferase involved in cell wall biosynthesis
MTQPLVTIGVPAYNEEKHIREAVESLLKQTYPNIRIIVADNGSTDATGDICRDMAASDPRVMHVRHPRNIGQNANFNYLPRIAEGTYFAWASAHDFVDADFIEKCVAALEANPDAVLATMRTVYLDEHGNKTGTKKRTPFDIRGMTPGKRFRTTMWRVDCNNVYGMWRLQAMRESHLFQQIPAPDRVMLAEVALKGPFVVADTAKYYRPNRGTVPQTEIEKRRRLMRFIWPDSTFTDAQLSGNSFYAPTVRAFAEVVHASGMGTAARWRCLFSVWLAGIVKFHQLPGADALSAVVKAILPKPLLKAVMRTMQ